MRTVSNSASMTWTAKTFLQWSTERLTAAGIDCPRLEAEVLLTGALKMRREDLYQDPDRSLPEEQWLLSKSFVERRLRREPVAYILEQREFWGLDFKVTPDVLVPRWETEILIEQFLQWNRSATFSESLRIADIGTGSGIIAIVAAKECPESPITAVDICSAALNVAKENARLHDVAEQIQFVESDLLAKVTGSFHAILSNPPYIETAVLGSLMPDVKDYEPHQALDGGLQGLDYYQKIIPQAWHHLVENGVLFLEIGRAQARAVSSLIESHGGYCSPKVMQDYSGCERVIMAGKREHG